MEHKKSIKHNYYLSILLTSDREQRIDNASYKSKSKGGGLFPAQFPGRARRSIFKVFSSIYWETFKTITSNNLQDPNEERRGRSSEPNRSEHPPPASARGSGSDTGPDPELSPSWKKKNSKQANL